MPRILETNDFIIEAYDAPHHSSENGGHIVIYPKKRYTHRYEIPTDLASDLMHLTMIAGEATTNILKKEGLDIARINYQDNGNWAYKKQDPKPHLHIHLYIRTWGEKHPDDDPRFQAFPDALVFPDEKTGYYKSFKPIDNKICTKIRDEILKLSKNPKYGDLNLLSD